jgi:hypothetical protein
MGWQRDLGKNLLTVGAGLAVGVGVTAAILAAPVAVPALAAVAVGGLAGSLASYFVRSWLEGTPVSAKEAALQGAFGAAVAATTLGLGEVLAPVASRLIAPAAPYVARVAPAATPLIMRSAANGLGIGTAGATAASGAQVANNVLDGRPLGENVVRSGATGFVVAAGLSAAATPFTRAPAPETPPQGTLRTNAIGELYVDPPDVVPGSAGAKPDTSPVWLKMDDIHISRSQWGNALGREPQLMRGPARVWWEPGIGWATEDRSTLLWLFRRGSDVARVQEIARPSATGTQWVKATQDVIPIGGDPLVKKPSDLAARYPLSHREAESYFDDRSDPRTWTSWGWGWFRREGEALMESYPKTEPAPPAPPPQPDSSLVKALSKLVPDAKKD